MNIPDFAYKTLGAFEATMTKPTYSKFCMVLLGAIICTGRKTCSNVWRILQGMNIGHPANINKFFLVRRLDAWKIGKAICHLVVKKLVKTDSITLTVDDTLTKRFGHKVFGRCRHRDPIGSSKGFHMHQWGLKWVVLFINYRNLRWSDRTFSLPVLVGLYTSKGWNFRNSKKHRTPIQILKIFLYRFRKWFPSQNIVLLGDRGYGSWELARFCSKLQVTLISRLPSKAILHDQTKVKQGITGRPAKYGPATNPHNQVEEAKSFQVQEILWYGNKIQKLETRCGRGHWRRCNKLQEIKWVYSYNKETEKEEYLYTNDLKLTKQTLLELYVGRWACETTFEECKQHLNLETPRVFKEKSIKNLIPSIFLLYTMVILMYSNLAASKQKIAVNWNGKTTISLSDILIVVRKEIWVRWVFRHPSHGNGFQKLKKKTRDLIMQGLTPCF